MESWLFKEINNANYKIFAFNVVLMCSGSYMNSIIFALYFCLYAYVYDLMITVTIIPRELRYIWEDVSHKLHEEQGMSY